MLIYYYCISSHYLFRLRRYATRRHYYAGFAIHDYWCHAACLAISPHAASIAFFIAAADALRCYIIHMLPPLRHCHSRYANITPYLIREYLPLSVFERLLLRCSRIMPPPPWLRHDMMLRCAIAATPDYAPYASAMAEILHAAHYAYELSDALDIIHICHWRHAAAAFITPLRHLLFFGAASLSSFCFFRLLMPPLRWERGRRHAAAFMPDADDAAIYATILGCFLRLFTPHISFRWLYLPDISPLYHLHYDILLPLILITFYMMPERFTFDYAITLSYLSYFRA